MPTMVIVDGPISTNPFSWRLRAIGVGQEMFDYCVCEHLVRMFMIGTVVGRGVKLRSQFDSVPCIYLLES